MDVYTKNLIIVIMQKRGVGMRTLLQNMSEEINIFKRHLLKNHIDFFQLSPDHLLIVSYKLIKVSSLYL